MLKLRFEVKPLQYLYITIITLSLLILNNMAQADVLHHKTQQLKNIKAKIHNTRQKIRNAQGERDALEDELKRNELAINHHLNHISKIRRNKKYQLQNLSNLNDKLRQSQKHLKAQQHILAQQIRLAYLTNNVNPVNLPMKLLVNEKNPATLQRLLTYQGYINHARLNIIKDTGNTITEILTYQQHIAEQNKRLQSLERQKLASLEELKNAKQHNKTVLTKLRYRISQNRNELQRLKESRQVLEKLLTELRLTPSVFNSKRPFISMKHHLPWPTLGNIPNPDTENRKPGLFIKAPDGQTVRSIYRGRVIFANWLRAYGLLLIVQHDSGFMSLYAHNESLYKKVGDSVQAGEIIAKVGHSGGNHDSGLYFEIRHHGKPVNPYHWCIKHHG